MANPFGAPLMVIGGLMIMAAGLLVGIGGPVLLRRLPEPADLNVDQTKIKYAELGSGRFAMITGALAVAGTALAVLTQPAAYWTCWLVYGVVAVLLAGIDARTTWLPSPLIYAGWIGLALAAAFGVIMERDHAWSSLLPIVAGAVIAGGGYFLLWMITGGRGIAFGDVRLMPLVGSIAGTMSWSGIYWSLLLGSVVGAVIGLARLARNRRGPFPYAPALVLGPYAAAALLAVL
jgi:leader peptidase (prepilin peptidase)/N-methyltransferase